MDAFESVVAMLLRREGYWTETSVKITLDATQKKKIGKPTTPRWEIDIVAYKGSENEILAVECKSYLDSRGVQFRNGQFDHPERFKLFTDNELRKVVLYQLGKQLTKLGACRPNPKVRLALATGKIASITRVEGLLKHFKANKWRLFDDKWIIERLKKAADSSYENDIALVVSKLIERNRELI